jgi:superfamily II DNA or RNA helicase
MPSAKPSSRAKPKAKSPAEPRLSRMRQPEGMSVQDWQTQLRRQFGREQAFSLENLGREPIFSEFAVWNPQSGGRYRVIVRGNGLGENYCACPDFATNDLGTCKHIEFVLARLEKKRGAKKAFKEGFQPPFSEIRLHYAGARALCFRPGAECPAALLERAMQLFDAKGGWRLPMERLGELEGFLAEAREFAHEVRSRDDALAFLAEIRDAAERRRALDAAYPQGAASPDLADSLKIRLYPYQVEGALFAARAGRALIGDEMGLGKTVQAIAAADLMAKHFGAERTLVVCPTSLKHQWKREIARFSGREAQIVQGGRALRTRQYREEGSCKIVNYETLPRDLDLIRAWAPDVVIVDEAQRIKNWNTLAARALKRIASPYAIVLTGTPLENRLEELISIVQFVDRHRLGPTWRLLHEHQLRDQHGRVVGYRDLDRLGQTLAPIMLRRRKSEVLAQLPERVDNTLFVDMTPQQRLYHEENGEIVARIVQRWRRTGFLSDADQRRLTCALQNMRMSCNSTYLLDHETDHGHKADELAALLAEWFETPDAKVVVFSSWRRTHELIARRLEANGWGYALFHGGVPSERRGALIERFLDDPNCRAFLSTDAGGVGLNLQRAAAIVVNMDLPWNPAVLEQRIGRVHRLGQSRSVQVVNFVAQGTIEEGMLSLLAFKKSLFAGVLDGGDNEVFLNGTRLSRFMESVEEATGAMGEAAPLEDPAESEAEAARAADALEEETQAPPLAASQEEAPPRTVELSPEPPRTVAPRVEAPAPPLASKPAEPAEPAGFAPERPSVAAAAKAGGDPWAELLGAGLKLVETLNASAAAGRDQAGGGREQAAAPAWIETDPGTGKTYLKMPMPEPETVQKLAGALAGLLANLQGGKS